MLRGTNDAGFTDTDGGGQNMKRFTTQILTAIGFVTFMTVVGLWSSPKLMAAIKAALVQNVDEPGRNPYQETKLLTCSAGSSFCSGDYGPVPVGKRLVVTNVSGRVELAVAGSGIQVDFSNQNGLDIPLLAISQGPGGFGAERRVVNQTVMAYFEPGGTPAIFVQNNGVLPVGSPTFSITGYYITLP
jgi:hypothetical protein